MVKKGINKNTTMEIDLIEAKEYLSKQGYGSGTNYTTNLVAVLLANYLKEKIQVNKDPLKVAHEIFYPPLRDTNTYIENGNKVSK